jgi:hypothetical protein
MNEYIKGLASIPTPYEKTKNEVNAESITFSTSMVTMRK